VPIAAAVRLSSGPLVDVEPALPLIASAILLSSGPACAWLCGTTSTSGPAWVVLTCSSFVARITTATVRPITAMSETTSRARIALKCDLRTTAGCCVLTGWAMTASYVGEVEMEAIMRQTGIGLVTER
jgi:hypothetical protein